MLYFEDFVPFSTVDYPGKIATVVFLQGCNCNCPYCYNKRLQRIDKRLISVGGCKKQERDKIYNFYSFLDKNKELLEGVVVTGGDPLYTTTEETGDNRCTELVKFLKEIHTKKYSIKLDTTGFHDTKSVWDFVDYFAIDFKHHETWKDKHKLNRMPDWYTNVNLLLKENSSAKLEFRTTVHPRVTSIKDLDAMAGIICNILQSHNRLHNVTWYWQQMLTLPNIKKVLQNNPVYSKKSLLDISQSLQEKYNISIGLRNIR